MMLGKAWCRVVELPQSHACSRNANYIHVCTYVEQPSPRRNIHTGIDANKPRGFLFCVYKLRDAVGDSDVRKTVLTLLARVAFSYCI